jgi:hypothetical protein
MLFTLSATILAAGLSACKSSGGIIGPSDQTAEAGAIIEDANKDLKEIRKLYDRHEDKREDLKKAMAASDGPAVRQICREIVDTINEGTNLGKNALDKIDKAREMNINEDYAEYLRLKWEALNKQLEAFEEYRQAARKLRDEYDPKDTQARAVVEADFKQRSEKFQKLMEKGRDHSSEANELAKEVLRRSKGE